MTSKVQIANQALSALGLSSYIQSFTENSAEARQCGVWYDQARKAALESYDWSFARKRAALAEHSDDPPVDWAYRYVYPADCVKLRTLQRLNNEHDAFPMQVEISDDGTMSVLCNIEDAIAVYTFDQETTSLFTPSFIDCHSFWLASYLAVPLTKKRALADDMRKDASRALRRAAGLNAGEEVAEAPREAEAIRARA